METKLQIRKVKPVKCRDHFDLWKLLSRHRKLRPLSFAEYQSVGHFTVEFCSLKNHIIVETESFSDLIEEDHEERDEYLKENGFTILRYRSILIQEYPSIIVEDVTHQAGLIR